VLKIDLDRLDGTVALPSLRPEKVSVCGEEAMIELRLSADHDIELYFPAPGGAVEDEWLGLASGVLIHLAGMDNEVQRVSAEECARSGYHSRYYESELAYITLARPDVAVLHYFGTGCNTEWDERFVRNDGQWVRAKPSEPGAATDHVSR
jgi:hypothetical protein